MTPPLVFFLIFGWNSSGKWLFLIGTVPVNSLLMSVFISTSVLAQKLTYEFLNHNHKIILSVDVTGAWPCVRQSADFSMSRLIEWFQRLNVKLRTVTCCRKLKSQNLKMFSCNMFLFLSYLFIF